MSDVPPELRDYVEPLVRVGHVTVTVYERCIQEAVRLGLSEAEGDAYMRRLAEEHDAILEAPARPEFAATAAWEPAPGSESSEDDPTKADALSDVPSDSEERAALEAAAREAEADESEAVESEAAESAAAEAAESEPGEPEAAEAAEQEAAAETSQPAIAIGGHPATVPEGLELGHPATVPEGVEVPSDAISAATEVTGHEETAPTGVMASPEEIAPTQMMTPGELPQPPASPSEADQDPDLVPAVEPLPTGGFRGIPWLHLTPVALAPLLVGLILASGGIEAAQDRFGGGDPFEPNNSFAEAKLISNGKHTGITLLRDDVDWFRVKVEAGRGLQITYENVPDEAAISLHDSSGARLERVGESVGELVYVPEGGQAEEVFLALSGSARELITLDVAQIDPRQRFEENDLPLQAAEVEPGQLSSLTCDGSDWFRVVVPRHCPISAKVDGGLGVRIVESGDRAALAKSPLELPGEAKADPRALPRAVLVQVVGRGDYTLDLDVGSIDPKSSARVGDDLQRIDESLEPNNRREEAVALLPGYYPKLRCDGRDYYTVKVPVGHSLILDWTGSPDLTFPTLRSRILGGDLDSINTPDNLKRKVVFAEKRAMEFPVLVRGRGNYALTCRINPGFPGRELVPGSYPQIRTSGEDLYWLVAKPDDKLDLDFDVGRHDRYGRQVEVTVVRVPLKEKKPNKRKRRQQGRSSQTEYISGLETITKRFYNRELVFVRVRGARRPYNLDVELQRTQAITGVGTYRPPTYEVVGPGTYVGRTVSVYGVDLEAGDVLEAKVSFSSQQGDLDVELLDSHGELVEDSMGEGDEELVSCESKVRQRVYVFVRDLSGVETPYDMEIKINEKAAPPEETPSLEKGIHRGLVCEGEAVYKLAVKQGQTVRATIRFDEKKGELDLGILNGQAMEQARAVSLGPSETLEYFVETAGHVYLRVAGEGKRFDLELAIQDP
jgi:hypothetical protein